MADSHDFHGLCAIINDVEHAVISDADAEAILTVKLLEATKQSRNDRDPSRYSG